MINGPSTNYMYVHMLLSQQLIITMEYLLQMLHLYAVDHALGSREPPLGKKDSEAKEKATLTQWLNQLRLSQSAINSILSLPSESELTKRARCVYVCE